MLNTRETSFLRSLHVFHAERPSETMLTVDKLPPHDNNGRDCVPTAPPQRPLSTQDSAPRTQHPRCWNQRRTCVVRQFPVTEDECDKRFVGFVHPTIARTGTTETLPPDNPTFTLPFVKA